MNVISCLTSCLSCPPSRRALFQSDRLADADIFKAFCHIYYILLQLRLIRPATHFQLTSSSSVYCKENHHPCENKRYTHSDDDEDNIVTGWRKWQQLNYMVESRQYHHNSIFIQHALFLCLPDRNIFFPVICLILCGNRI